MSTETRTGNEQAKTRKCPRCGDTIQFLPDEPLCSGCRQWARRMAEAMHARERRRSMEVKDDFQHRALDTSKLRDRC